jgi:hypothetical protein
LFTPVTAQSLARVTEQDKLFIFAHGSNVGIAWMADETAGYLASTDNSKLLATFLRNSGLRRVGLITFKSCFVGRSNFLNKFAVELAREGIRAGWLKGYKGAAETIAKDGGGFTEKITSKGATLVSEGQDVVNNDRYKIVRGPGGLFEGSTQYGRYQGTTSEKDSQAFAALLGD